MDSMSVYFPIGRKIINLTEITRPRNILEIFEPSFFNDLSDIFLKLSKWSFKKILATIDNKDTEKVIRTFGPSALLAL